ncbi:MAG: helix-turn-helix domain-containing protein [Myxococcales bacterium]|nr:helix-turn-helix domain-containing protein [Myxococcales bacterium]
MKPFRERSYYELLEVPVSAKAPEIRAAYERLCHAYESEAAVPAGPDGELDLQQIRELLLEAVEILSDDDLRAEYDQTLSVQPPDSTAEEPRAAEEQESRQLAMTELISGAEAVHSTFPGYSVSYVPHSPHPQEASETSNGPPPAEPPAAQARPKPSRTAETAVAQPIPEPQPELDQPRPPRPSPQRPVERARKPAQPELEMAPEISQEGAIGIAEAALAQVSARIRERPPPPPPPESRAKPIEIPSDAEFTGELLRKVRQSRGLNLGQLAERTRIAARHLENIEADHYDALPATVYLRGILMSVARELGLDPLRVSKSYLAVVATRKK